MDSRLRRSPPDRASAVPYGQAGENAMRFPHLAHRSAAAHKLHSTPQQDRMNLISGKGETSSRLPGPFSLFLPGSCPNNRNRRSYRKTEETIVGSTRLHSFPIPASIRHHDERTRCSQLRHFLDWRGPAAEFVFEKKAGDRFRNRFAGIRWKTTCLTRISIEYVVPSPGMPLGGFDHLLRLHYSPISVSCCSTWISTQPSGHRGGSQQIM